MTAIISGETVHALAGCTGALALFRSIDKVLVGGLVGFSVRFVLAVAIGAGGFAWEYGVQPIVAGVLTWWDAAPSMSQAFAFFAGACVALLAWECGKVVRRGMGSNR